MKTASLLLLLFSKFVFSQNPINYLKEYVEIDTKESTKESASFFKRIFKENEVEYQIIENGLNPIILAKIYGTDKSLKPILLAHHMDCVQPAKKIKFLNNNIYGPCILDDKSLGIAHLVAFLEAKKVKPKRSIYFLAVSDEEKGGKEGMRYLLEKNFLSEIAFALGEGGRSSAATDKKLFSMISTSEKGAIWLKVKIPLKGGHSGSGDDSALKEVLKKLLKIQEKISFSGENLKELQNFVLWYKDAFPSKRKIPLKIEEVEGPFKQFVFTTSAITSIETDGGLNLLPTYISFQMDIRTADKKNHQQVIETLEKEFPGAEFQKILEIYPAPPTPSDNIYFKNILKELEKILPEIPKGPGICAGFTDLHYLREKGIPSFGFSPFFLNYYHENTIHKELEYIPIERFLEGCEIMKKLVLNLSEK